MSNPYHEAKIYKITNPHTDKVYIGSTTQRLLSNRMASHRYYYRQWNGGGKPNTNSHIIFDASEDIKETKIELIKIVKCETKRELLDLEYTYINTLSNCVNQITGITLRDDYGERLKKQNIESYYRVKERNPELIKERRRQQYEKSDKQLNLKKERERNAKLKEENPELLKQRRRKKYDRSVDTDEKKEQKNKKQREWYAKRQAENPELFKQKLKEYRLKSKQNKC